MSTGRLAGKVAIVTGAARGMGAETARLFAAEGARVVLGDVVDDGVREVAAGIGASARAVRLDVTREDDWEAAVRAALDAFGRLDVLVNNAGIAHSAPTLDCKPDDFRRVLEVNLVGPFLGTRAVAPVMGESGGGSIINISSVQGMVGRAGLPAYTASKFGLRGLTKTTALDLGVLGVRVNSIHPGGVDTQLLREAAGGIELSTEVVDRVHAHLPVPRVGRPRDIAATSLFLASDESAYITGTEIVVDGGLIAGIPGAGGR